MSDPSAIARELVHSEPLSDFDRAQLLPKIVRALSFHGAAEYARGLEYGSQWKDALEDMVEQFAYSGTDHGKPCLSTGGLSALEHAFGVLGWDDPHVVEEAQNSE